MLKLGSFTFTNVHVTEDIVSDNHATIICDLLFEDEVMLERVIVGSKFWKDFRDAVKLAGEVHKVGAVNLQLLKLLLISNKDY
ncbi:hypothetical protein NP212_17750 [Salmonella enterica]|nr:hypothetical protein [Salmonella enterica]